MDGYLQKTVHGGSQPQPYVNRMAPPPQAQMVDPRMVAAVLAQMQQGQMTPMSQQDTIVIQNRAEPPAVVVSGQVDPMQEAALNFSRSPMGQQLIHGTQGQPCGYQNQMADERANPLIAATAKVLNQAFHQASGGADYNNQNFQPYGW